MRARSLALLVASSLALLAAASTGSSAATVSAGVLSCPAGTGQVSVVCDQSAFLDGGEVAALVTFEQPRTFDPDRKVVPFRQMKFVSWGSDSPYWSVDPIGTQNGKLYRKFSGGTDLANASVYFANRGSVTRFGFLLHPFGYPNQFVVRVVGADGARTDLVLPRDTGDIYLGLTGEQGIKKVKVIQRPDLADGVVINFGFDDVARDEITPAS